MNISVGANFRARLQHWFPDREFFMRSQGHVRFIKVSSRVQIAGAGAVAAALILWAVSMSAVAISQFVARHDRNSLLMREAKVEKAENRVNAYRKNLGQVADDLALTGRETTEELLARRRSFARENHPDRAPADLRGNATLRMKIANMLLDETIRRLAVEKSLGLR